MPAAVLLGGDELWLRRLLGISLAPQVASFFHEAMGDNTAKRWNGVAARRTTQSDTNNYGRYLVTCKSLDAAGCTGEPLLVIGYICAFCTVAWPLAGSLWPSWRPKWEIVSLTLQGRYRKFCTATGLACGWWRTTHRTGRRPTTCSGPRSKLHRCLHTSTRTPRGKRLWGGEHC